MAEIFSVEHVPISRYSILIYMSRASRFPGFPGFLVAGSLYINII